MDPWNLIWIFLILTSLQPLVQKHLLALSRRRMLAQIAEKRDATVITLIHRQETMLAARVPAHAAISTSTTRESVLKAISAAPRRESTIEIILHTPRRPGAGGAVRSLAALRDHDGRVVGGRSRTTR